MKRNLLLIVPILAAASVTCIAGTLEGFFSPSAAPVALKLAVGGTLFTLLLVWLFRPMAAAQEKTREARVLTP